MHAVISKILSGLNMALLILNPLSFLLAGLQYGLQFPALAGNLIGATLTTTACLDVFFVIVQGQTLDFKNPYATRLNRTGYLYLMYFFVASFGFFLLAVAFPAPAAFALLWGVFVIGFFLNISTLYYQKREAEIR